MTLANPFTGLGQREESAVLQRQATGDAPAAERLRQALADRGPSRAAELAKATGLPHSSLVGALLKHDLHIGRVIFCEGRYDLDADYDESERGEIQAAVALLRRKGYTVQEPR